GKLKKFSDLRQIILFATAPTTRVRESHQRRRWARSDLVRLVPGFPAWWRPFCWRGYIRLLGWQSSTHSHATV
ncbi:unnamed protein product, partial [Ixodes pacificus]